MADIDEELRLDAIEDEKEMQYIRQHLPADTHDLLEASDIYDMMDAIVEYYYESGVLEAEGEYVDIDLQAVADYVCNRLEQDKGRKYHPDDVYAVVEADFDYNDERED
jgi:hypothetical protein